ncbi:MAG TPA: hypothetical protein VF572_01245 [Candidatus Saccharimonadales bacterium]|jgi:gas vesicle protein
MKNRTKGIAIGTLIAGVMGYVAGILTAPKTGKETRRYLGHVRSSGMAEAERTLKKLHTELSELLGEADDTVKHGGSKKQIQALEGEVMTKASRARQKARELLSAIHDGNVDDKDLDKAVTEATKAIKSIRSYLKK